MCHSDKPLEDVIYNVITIEFQQRGSLHVHCLIWVKDAPCINVQSDEDVYIFIDLLVCGMISEDTVKKRYISNIVINLETHIHSQYWLKIRWDMQFASPKASPCTLICREPPDEDNYDDSLKTSCEVLERFKKYMLTQMKKQTLEIFLKRLVFH